MKIMEFPSYSMLTVVFLLTFFIFPYLSFASGAFCSYAAYAEISLSQIALCLLITNIVSPFLCKLSVKLWGCPKIPKNTSTA